LTIKLAIIGLGTIGKRILNTVDKHSEVEVVAVYDQAAVLLDQVVHQHISIEQCAQALINRADVDVVYIGTPPATHILYCELALQAGKTIWCEKPLAIDVDQATAFIKKLEATQVKAVVNLSLASSPVVAQISKMMDDIPIGDISSVEFQMHYSSWPRRWQSGASSWLCMREQGGFLREVFSHFVFLHQRLIGDLELQQGRVEYSDENLAETYVQAHFATHGIPVRLQGVVGGNVPDTNNWIVYAKHKSIHLSGFRALKVSENDSWQDIAVDLAGDLDMTQLNEVVKMVRNQPHKLASFQEALKVQHVVEELLAKG